MNLQAAVLLDDQASRPNFVEAMQSSDLAITSLQISCTAMLPAHKSTCPPAGCLIKTIQVLHHIDKRLLRDQH